MFEVGSMGWHFALFGRTPGWHGPRLAVPHAWHEFAIAWTPPLQPT
jgi:hypothetical protein